MPVALCSGEKERVLPARNRACARALRTVASYKGLKCPSRHVHNAREILWYEAIAN